MSSAFLRFLAGFLLVAGTACAETWSTRIAHPVYPPDTSVTLTSAAKYLTLSDDDLRALITETGGRGINVEMTRAAYDLAALYQRTGDDRYADRAVLILERFAEVVPRWPVPERGTGKPLQLAAVPWEHWGSQGLWHIWFHQDLEKAVEIPLAYDWIASSGALERRSERTGKDVRELIERDLLRYMVELNLRYSFLLNQVPRFPDGRAPFDYSNMGGNRINGIIPFGRVFEPEYIHMVVEWLRRFPTAMYFRDGVWHEGTPSYHLQITRRITRILPNLLKGYSDPPGYRHPQTGQRIDNLDLAAELGPRYARMNRALEMLTLPDGRFFALHDTHSDQRASIPLPDSARSRCLFGVRHAVMVRGSGAEKALAHFHFGGADGHEHYDCLNLALWTLGGELLSEGEYRKFGSREWNTSTAGHNLVMVDEKNQLTRFDRTRTPGPDDAVDGLPYNPCRYGQGDSRTFGNLFLWDSINPDLQAVEAGGENAYEGVSRYRRTLVMSGTGDDGFYLLDIFRVRGGRVHDWMLHGRLDEDYAHRSSLKPGPASGTRFGYFSLAETAKTDSLWWSEFLTGSGARIRTTMLSAPGTEVSRGRAPAMRREGEATFLDVRRYGGDNCFVAVHEPYRDVPRIARVTSLTPPGGADSFVALKIELADGRTDYIAHTLDVPPFPERRVPGTDIRFRGRLALVSLRNGAPERMYLLEGSSLRAGKASLSAQGAAASFRGRVTGVERVEKGDRRNAFITSPPLPEGSALTGRTLLLTLADGRTEGYTIARIEHAGEQSFIHVEGEPGLELRDGGRLAKLVYYPWHGVRGPVDFHIAGRILREE